jgi:hypothetical protein
MNLQHFMQKVEVPPNGAACWLWLGDKKGPTGYGRYKRKRAHRCAWEMMRGPIPDGLIVCHHCDEPRCVNPSHLFVGTHLQNVQDCARKGRNGMTVHPERRPRGERHGAAILTDAEAADIVQLYPSTASRILAARFGVSASCIRKIGSGINRAGRSRKP